MANTSRRKISREGKMFLPMNMQGSSGKEYFITVPKLAIICAIAFWIYLVVGWGSNVGLNILGWLIMVVLNGLVLQWVIRKFILEEDYFYGVYEEQEKLKDTTPDLMWRIPFINHTQDGDIFVYDDMKAGCILRLERDTIVGKAEDGAERHFDAWSNFYRELHNKHLGFVQLNLMEPSGKDPRLNTLALTANNVPNESIKYALELEVGHLKRISNAMLSEFEYVLVYSSTLAGIDRLIPDAVECAYSLLDGAYATAKVMTEKEIYELPKSMSNVTFFDGIQAQMNVYLNDNRKIPNILRIKQVKTSTDGVIAINEKQKSILDKLATLVENGELKYGEWTVKRALDGNIDKLNNFNKKKNIASKPEEEESKNVKNKKKKEKPKRERKSNKKSKSVEKANEEALLEEDDTIEDEILF